MIVANDRPKPIDPSLLEGSKAIYGARAQDLFQIRRRRCFLSYRLVNRIVRNTKGNLDLEPIEGL
jgi:hypothetical protein